ncbi:U3-aranetoxin-Ce1a-like isoform X1 [Elysia marginata]|uniref:U3-aranetoxin-Ce1a-like isoform X1 n=1 Tax=Elysia marginata TaxID=1093978 RepID=A0AAV4FGE7_9GAST|nr:U3-aranetoxin-Ce1a-like isoform X1 [Elysia marginata]
MKVLAALTIACLFAVTYAAVGQICTDESQCDAGECCQILSEFMVVSKKDLQPIKLDPSIQKTGTCQKYKMEGAYCNSFEKMNGYCSCAPGLSCHTYQVALPTKPVMTMAPTVATHMISAARRSMLAPQDGYKWVSKCEKMTP